MGKIISKLFKGRDAPQRVFDTSPEKARQKSERSRPFYQIHFHNGRWRSRRQEDIWPGPGPSIGRGKVWRVLRGHISLLVYRLLEKKTRNKYTCSELLGTLRSMQVTRLSKESGYIPSYKRTDLTDELHKVFGFRTDYEFISRSAMRSIIKSSKTDDTEK